SELVGQVGVPHRGDHMGGTANVDDLLSSWLHAPQARVRVRGYPPVNAAGRLRFAFYGRISTGEYQDAASSRAWQLASATRAIAGHGRIVAEYFDVGCSRRLPWAARPQAAALLDALTGPERVFDAVMVGEYERAFHGDQLGEIATQMTAHAVQLWLP